LSTLLCLGPQKHKFRGRGVGLGGGEGTSHQRRGGRPKNGARIQPKGAVGPIQACGFFGQIRGHGYLGWEDCKKRREKGDKEYLFQVAPPVPGAGAAGAGAAPRADFLPGQQKRGRKKKNPGSPRSGGHPFACHPPPGAQVPGGLAFRGTLLAPVGPRGKQGETCPGEGGPGGPRPAWPNGPSGGGPLGGGGGTGALLVQGLGGGGGGPGFTPR